MQLQGRQSTHRKDTAESQQLMQLPLQRMHPKIPAELCNSANHQDAVAQ